MNKKIFLKTVFLVAALLTFSTVQADDDDQGFYQPADGICSKCNCTTVNGTIQSGESGRLLTLDCSMKGYEKLFAGWPEEMGDNHTDVEVIYIMSLSKIDYLRQIPATDAIVHFTCRHCKMSSIQSHAFIDASNIVSLDLAFNNIKSSELFAAVFKGPDRDDEYSPIKLETLDLGHNQINSLDKLLFEHTPHLRSLDLSNNPFITFDDHTNQALASLRNLEILDLSFTGILELPGIILEHMEKLSEIFLNGNKFLVVPKSLFAVGKSLEYLHLSNNPIEIIDVESFNGLSKVEKLNISAMPELAEIKENSMKHLTSLEVLHCRGNKKLENFNMEDLRKLKHLMELDISNNSLTALNFGYFEVNDTLKPKEQYRKFEDEFKRLRVLKLAGNPWNCDCHIMKSLSLFDHNASYFKKSFNNDEARCKTPYDLSSKLLYDLPIEYVCHDKGRHSSGKTPQIYEPPQFLRPKSIMLTVFSVVGVIIVGIMLGFVIVCVKRRLKSNEEGYSTSPIRYTTVRNSTVSNIVNAPYSQ